MDRLQLEEAIFRACEVVGQKRVLVVGSQAVHASVELSRLPDAATMSIEADIAPEHDIAEFLTTTLWNEAGQGSEWANENGFYIDAVSADTAYLPDGWRARAIELELAAHPGYVGICPELHDLCASKMARNETKDREFVRALAEARLINARLLRNRLDEISDERFEPARKRAARRFIIQLQNGQSSGT